MFKDNMCDGLVHLTKENGEVSIGEYNKNVVDGKSTVYDSVGYIYNMTSKEGELIGIEEVTTENPAWFGNGVPLVCDEFDE